MIEALLPDGVAWAERFDDVTSDVLFAEEAATVARAVPKRRSEFATGRWCARRALAELGFPPAPILPGERGAPGWPPGVVGAITHCAGFRAAAVARADTALAIGLDAEPHAPLPAGVLDTVSLPAERGDLAQLVRFDPSTCWDRLLFSVKETIYKAWYPLVRRQLGFEQARVSFDPAGRFHARVLVDGPLLNLEGRWAVDRGLVVSAVVVPARVHPPSCASLSNG